MNEKFRSNMKFIILLSSIYLVTAGSVNPSPRSVNVALETSFLFEPKDINDNISFIKNIKVFLDKLYKILAPQAKEMQQFRSDSERRFSFGDFLKNMGEKFVNLTSEKAHEAVSIMKKEVSKITEQSKDSFNKILPDNMVKKLEYSVKKWARTQPEVLKDNVKKLMTDHNPLLHSFARRMNDYYNEHDVEKLNKILKKLNRHLDQDMDPTKIIKEGLHFGIIEKYKNLNETLKANLKEDMKSLLEFITKNEKRNVKAHEPNKETARKRNNQDLDLSESNRENVEDPSNSIEKDGIYNELKKTINSKLNLPHDKNKEHDKKPLVTNEIVVDNVELFVKSDKRL